MSALLFIVYLFSQLTVYSLYTPQLCWGERLRKGLGNRWFPNWYSALTDGFHRFTKRNLRAWDQHASGTLRAFPEVAPCKRRRISRIPWSCDRPRTCPAV